MAINTIKATIQMRKGLEQDFDADQMTAGEWAVSTDTKYVRMCFAPGIVLRMATYEGFEVDMEEIQNILKECQDIQVAVDAMAKSAQKSKTDAESSAKLSESWAKGGTGVRQGENTNNSKYFSDIAKALTDEAEKLLDQAQKVIVAATQGALIPGGTVTFENLPTNPATGYMYNISNDFTTDSRFEDGAGIFYRAGANVYWTAGGKWDVLIGTQVTGVKGSKESTYRVGNVNLTPDDIGAVALENVDSALSTTSTNPVQNKVVTDNALLLNGGTLIPSSSDLNNYKTRGTYYCENADSSTTITNKPFGQSPFLLAVTVASGRMLQTIVGFWAPNGIYSRYLDGSAWTPWKMVGYQLSDGSNVSNPGTYALDAYKGKQIENNTWMLSGGTAIPKNSDLNDYRDVGNYYCSIYSHVQTLKNCPVNLPFVMKVEYSIGNNPNYRRQVIRAFNYGSLIMRETDGNPNVFGAWKQMDFPLINNLTTTEPGKGALDAYQGSLLNVGGRFFTDAITSSGWYEVAESLNTVGNLYSKSFIIIIDKSYSTIGQENYILLVQCSDVLYVTELSREYKNANALKKIRLYIKSNNKLSIQVYVDVSSGGTGTIGGYIFGSDSLKFVRNQNVVNTDSVSSYWEHILSKSRYGYVQDNFKSLTQFTEIPSGADLKSDAYLVPGNYSCSSSNKAVSLVNCPLNAAFILVVSHATGSAEYIKQTFEEFRGERKVVRIYDSVSSSWMDPYKYTPDTGLAYIDVDNINDITIPDVGYFSLASRVPSGKTLLFATVKYFQTLYGGCFNVYASGSTLYVFGNPGCKITKLGLRLWYRP